MLEIPPPFLAAAPLQERGQGTELREERKLKSSGSVTESRTQAAKDANKMVFLLKSLIGMLTSV